MASVETMPTTNDFIGTGRYKRTLPCRPSGQGLMTRRAAVVKPIRQFDRELRDGDLLDVKLLDGTTSLRRLRKSQHGLKLVCEAGTAADYDGAIILGVVVGELTEYVRDGGSSN